MATTYGERLLADAEERERRKRQLRRLILLFAPAATATILATFQTIGFRNAGTDGIIREVVDAGAVLGFAGLLVLLPLYASFAPAPNAVTAVVALAAGPIAMPMIFGSGWRLWHRALVALVCLLVIAARSSQPRRTSLLRRRGRRR